MKRNTYIIKRLALGLLVMTMVSIVLAFLPPLFSLSFESDQFFLSQPLPVIEQSLKIAVAAFVGAYVARVPFVMATIVYYAGISLYVFYVLMLIAGPVQPVSILEVIARNAIGTALGLLAAIAGAELGFRLAYQKPDGLLDSI